MKIRVGFEFVYEFVERTPMVLMLNVHPSRAGDLIRPDQLRITPTLPVTRYADMFGNVCSRVVAPAGRIEICADARRRRFRAGPMRSSPARGRTRSPSFRTTRWYSCSAADTARPSAS